MPKRYSSTSFAFLLAGILSVSGIFFTQAYAEESVPEVTPEVHFETSVVADAFTFVAEHGTEEHREYDGHQNSNHEQTNTTDDSDAEDSHTTTHTDAQSCQNEEPSAPSTPLPATIVATKIVCANESDLPNWGAGNAADISSTTATDWVASHSGCAFVEGWKFQYAEGYTYNPGDAFVNMAGAPWTTTLPTNAQGVTTWQVPVMQNGSSLISVREVLLSGYLPFSHEATPDNSNTVSAEIYCASDVYNYDNLDYVTNPQSHQTYYCVAWNVRQGVVSENKPPVITLVGATPVTLFVGETFTDLGATAQDPEDGVLVPVVTGGVNTGVVGTYTIRYTATDSKGLSVFVERTVNVIPVGAKTICSDGIDNDNDGAIDFPADAGCSSAADNDENNAPIITLIGEGVMNIVIGNTYTDLGATASDTEDGNITTSIVATGTVNTTTLGAYTIRYNVSDSKGLAATEVTRTVNIIPAPVTPPPSGGGGGGATPPKCANGQDDDSDGKADYPQDPGCTDSLDNDETDTPASGGGTGIPGLQIFNEKLTVISPTSVTITWNTNLLSDSRVVYGDLSKNPVGAAPQYGYQNTTATATQATSSHSMTIAGLPENSVAFFRPISQTGGNTVVGIELVTPLVAGSCTYLEKYLRLGYDNDPVEVTKLQRFLKEYEGFTNLAVTGIFDITTDKAVRAFQDKYGAEVLAPWGLPGNTGYVYYTTQKKVNEIYCKKAFPLTTEQLKEMDTYVNISRTTTNIGSGVGTIETSQPTITVTTGSSVGMAPKAPVIDLSKIKLTEVAPKTPVVALVPEKTTGEIAGGVTTEDASTGKGTSVASYYGSLRNLVAAIPSTFSSKNTESTTGSSSTTDEDDIVPCTSSSTSSSTPFIAGVAGALGIGAGTLWVWFILFLLVLVLGYATGRRSRQEA